MFRDRIEFEEIGLNVTFSFRWWFDGTGLVLSDLADDHGGCIVKVVLSGQPGRWSSSQRPSVARIHSTASAQRRVSAGQAVTLLSRKLRPMLAAAHRCAVRLRRQTRSSVLDDTPARGKSGAPPTADCTSGSPSRLPHQSAASPPI